MRITIYTSYIVSLSLLLNITVHNNIVSVSILLVRIGCDKKHQILHQVFASADINFGLVSDTRLRFYSPLNIVLSRENSFRSQTIWCAWPCVLHVDVSHRGQRLSPKGPGLLSLGSPRDRWYRCLGNSDRRLCHCDYRGRALDRIEDGFLEWKHKAKLLL